MNTYTKLRPWTEIESCSCSHVISLLLVYMFTDNPIHCATCRKEIDPEKLNFTASKVDEIASSLGVYAALYDLWLDSGEYEAYAKQKLTDPQGQVNQNGMSVAKKLSARLPTYYWWFHDTDDGDSENCPSCSKPLDTDVEWGTGKCDSCGIVI